MKRYWKEEARKEGLIMVSFDTELYGHWWFEGIEFIKQVIKNIKYKISLMFLSIIKLPNTTMLNPNRNGTTNFLSLAMLLGILTSFLFFTHLLKYIT